MAKVPTRYLEINPWTVTEQGFHPEQSKVSESIFSLGNEFMGVRGYFEEGFSGPTLLGSYFNGVFEETEIKRAIYFKGFARRFHFIVNSVDWLHVRLTLDNELLDLAQSKFTNFVRTLDMRTGTLTREFVWVTRGGKQLQLRFSRFLSMETATLGGQRIEMLPLNFSGTIGIQAGLSFETVHEEFDKIRFEVLKKGAQGDTLAILGQTPRTHQRVLSACSITSTEARSRKLIEREKFIGYDLRLVLKQGVTARLDKMVVNHVDKRNDRDPGKVWNEGIKKAASLLRTSYDAGLETHARYWQEVWSKLDVTIEGDDGAQQGLRFCIFQLHQTYHGVDPSLNISAKGLTGEQYAGHAWWDTETYCLPFYLFNNPKAAHNLLGYRYSTLPTALEVAKEISCKGARYPLSTIDGTNATILWQHGDLEIHSSVAIAYGIWHYMRVCDDKEFLHTQGIEMLLQICRFYASWGEWSPRTGEFGFYGVMGPDEFHMMVNNNCYTNYVVKKMMEYTLSVVADMKRKAAKEWKAVVDRTGLEPRELKEWAKMAAKMRIPRDRKTGILEQHDGYFDLPHIDCDSIPPEQFPLYQHWPYIKLFRYDMIKQPDALLLPFFFSEEFTLREKKANYEYYEPRCIHESSLSPGVHSIMAAELGLHKEAYEFSAHAARMDLDDYNRNTHEGLHTTSMAAAWMNVVYGFGGMRSDGELPSFNPCIPKQWKSFAFRILYKGSVLQARIDRKQAEFTVVEGTPVKIRLFGKVRTVSPEGLRVAMPAHRVA